MNVRAKIVTTVNSDGIWYPSVSVYFSGCDNPTKCPHCHNPELQNPLYGTSIGLDVLIKDIDKKLKILTSTFDKVALVFVGGEPLAPYNIENLLTIGQSIATREKVTQIAYTWRYLEDIEKQNLWNKLVTLDYLVCGPFMEQYADLDFTPASTNQYIYDVKGSRKIDPIRRIS